jgi:hypothetical protein
MVSRATGMISRAQGGRREQSSGCLTMAMDPPTDWPAYGQRVLEALRSYFAEGKWLLEPATLIQAHLDFDADGVAVLLAVYDHPLYPQRIGLRRRLDRELGSDPESLAEQIAIYGISEPMGRYYDLLVEDEAGVWWWGDGYPDIGEHPDFNLKRGEVRSVSCLLRGSFEPYPRRLEPGTLVLADQHASWTSTQDVHRQALSLDFQVEAVRSRPARFQEQRTNADGTVVLMPSPITVTCVTPLGHIELVVAPADAAIVYWFFTRMIP